jgi:endonuclease/exonuclease/phosphatase family metal-dependent hydrolase
MRSRRTSSERSDCDAERLGPLLGLASAARAPDRQLPEPGPDILLLQEVVDDGASDQAAEIADALSYPYLARALTQLDTGVEEDVAIASRLPLRAARCAELPASRTVRQLAIADMTDGPGGPFTVVLLSRGLDVRAAQVELLGSASDGDASDHALVCADYGN